MLGALTSRTLVTGDALPRAARLHAARNSNLFIDFPIESPRRARRLADFKQSHLNRDADVQARTGSIP